MSRGHVAGTLQTGVQPLQAFPTGQSLTGYAEHVYEQPEGEPPVETNSIRYWRDWAGLRNGQTELRLNNQRAPRVHGLGWGLDPDAGVWRPLRVDSTGALVVAGGGPVPEIGPPTSQLGAWFRADDAGVIANAPVSAWADRSGNGNDLTLTPATTPATWKATVAGFNNRPAVEFAGLTRLEKAFPPSFQPGTHAVTWYIVFQHSFATGAQQVWGYGQQPTGAGQKLTFLLNVGPNRMYADGAAAFYETQTQANSLPKIFSFTMPTGGAFNTAEARINNELATPTGTAGGINISSPVQLLTMGGWPTSEFFGQIAELLYYHKHHNTNERLETLLYLSNRYGIALV